MRTGADETTIRVTKKNRDALASIAQTELGGASLDEALRSVIFEHQTRAAFARMNASQLADYQAEAQQLADIDPQVTE
ncbi:hypothetical protein [Natronoglycomyces albus]|uniref:Uncharacterized protein n=1 Tax=Natronoglycomyces albus TaxID=2811108 RepID=A0A895XRS9_9ACTN|nr:hypothetical protein [Natronoglycomyces albus]QSB04960.1 hypothetical protein JQS30_14530 [Natronoglycomyces albus]